MGRKVKLGKRRKDKFYHLAKETGFRARSAFKLVQLNRKYHFLQSSRVLIDLCAAPGGWLQVAAKSMPISSLIVGVDLVPIKPIPNVITLQEDITTARCKQLLQRELKTWKADCVLNDGAPNVGAAWVQDAFSQAELTLAALKLASAFLREGGWFITKIFRSKDYQPLMWVLQQLFKKVHATKPQASRIESAEIFVVCRGYLSPSVIDQKMFDPSHVFQEVEQDKTEEKINLVKLQKQPKAAEGYPDNVNVLFKTTPVADFILGENHLRILKNSNQLIFDLASEVFSRHPLTSEEIRESCRDLKVLGPRELKQLVKWREKMRIFLDEVESEGEEEGEGHGGEEKDHGDGEDELEGIDSKVEALASKEAAEVKREIRHLRKQRKKLKERLVVKGGVAEETGELIRQEHLFRLKDIQTQNQLDKVVAGEQPEEQQDSDSDNVASNDDDEEDSEKEDSDGKSSEEDEGDISEGDEEDGNISGEETPAAADTPTDNPLLVSLSADSKAKRRKLDPEGLAIGALMVQSKKKCEDLIESGYNRWTNNDENLPDWFIDDESRFYRKSLPITKEMVEVYRAKLKEINSRPIKKVAEAKARKKKRALRSLEKARKKAESIADAVDVSSHEKAQQIKQIYKKAGTLGKKKGKVEYVVAKKGSKGKVRRPPGVKGRYKVVDRRMKKDKRGMAAKNKKQKRRK